jgi:hypothetical protein
VADLKYVVLATVTTHFVMISEYRKKQIPQHLLTISMEQEILEALTVARTANEFLAFYGTPKFVTMFTQA